VHSAHGHEEDVVLSHVRDNGLVEAAAADCLVSLCPIESHNQVAEGNDMTIESQTPVRRKVVDLFASARAGDFGVGQSSPVMRPLVEEHDFRGKAGQMAQGRSV
jgi:hypothetical protein